MYLSHFGLQQLPFSITPDPDFFFVGNKRGEILEALIYAVEHGDGIIKVTGEVGCGKTMLCRMLERRLPDNIEVIYLVNPTLSHDQVIFTIAGELDLPILGKRVDEVIRLLHSELINKHASGKQVVLLIEEAQAMSMQTLEEIRLFSNLETAHYKLLQIVLFGQPELDEHLNVPSMRQLKERITNSFKLPPLTATTIPDYLMFRLRAAGYHGSALFDDAAIKLINRVSEGIVRRISILADKSLLAAFANNAYSVGAEHVMAAIEDSEFSNSPITITSTQQQRRIAALALLTITLLGAGWYVAQNHSSLATAVKLSKTTQPFITPVKAQDAVNPVVIKAAPAPSPVLVNSTINSTINSPTVQSRIQPETQPVIASTSASIPATAAPFTIVQETTKAPPSNNQVNATAVQLTLDQRIKLSLAWLSQQATDGFCIQLGLIASGNQEEAARFLHKMESDLGLQHVYIYSAHKSAATAPPYYGIVFGSYPNRNDALAMLNMLSAQWNLQPQLRTFSGIKREIKIDKNKEINSSK